MHQAQTMLEFKQVSEESKPKVNNQQYIKISMTARDEGIRN